MLPSYDMLYVRLHQMSPVEVYYTLLNSGFRIPVSAGSDKMGNFVPMGSARVYVNMEGPLTYKKWVEGIKLGKTFVTSGPMIYLTVNRKGIGDTITVTPGQLREGKYVASVEARAESREPYRFERLELIVNGQVASEVYAAKRGTEANLKANITLTSSSWIAARCYGEDLLPYGHPTTPVVPQPVIAHTGPIYLELPGSRICDPEAASLLLDHVRYLKDWIENKAHYSEPQQKKTALAQASTAEIVIEGLLEEQCAPAPPGPKGR